MSTIAATWQSTRSRSWFWPVVILLIAVSYAWWYDIAPFSTITLDWLGLELDVAVIIGVYVMLALGLNIVVGYAGLLDLGYVAFFAIGAYTVGWLASVSQQQGHPRRLDCPESLVGIHVSIWIVILAVATAARRRDHRVADAATARRLPRHRHARLRRDHPRRLPQRRFDERSVRATGDAAVHRLLREERHERRARGIKPLDAAGFPELSGVLPFLPDRFSRIEVRWWYLAIIAIVVVTIFVITRLQYSKLGRAWIAVREDEIAASAMGVPLMRTKLWAYAIGAIRRLRRRLLRLVHRRSRPDRVLLQHLRADPGHGRRRRDGQHRGGARRGDDRVPQLQGSGQDRRARQRRDRGGRHRPGGRRPEAQVPHLRGAACDHDARAPRGPLAERAARRSCTRRRRSANRTYDDLYDVRREGD